MNLVSFVIIAFSHRKSRELTTAYERRAYSRFPGILLAHSRPELTELEYTTPKAGNSLDMA